MNEQREQLLDGWERAALGWARQAERMRQWLAPLSDRMLTRAELAPGVRFVELAAGPGDLSLLAAPLVAPTTVLCTDAVEAMVQVARERVAEHEVDNIEFARLQLEWIDLPAASADVIACRLGLMLCVDPQAALQECRRVLAPGGRLVVGVWADRSVNAAFSLPQDLATELGLAPPLPEEGPGPFALSDRAQLAEMLHEAGFFEVAIEPVELCDSFTSETDWIGAAVDRSPAFGELWRGLADRRRVELKDALRRRAEPFTEPDGTISARTRALAVLGVA